MNQLLTLHKFLGRIRNIQGSALPHQNREDSVGQYAFEELDAVCDTLGYSSLRLDSIFLHTQPISHNVPDLPILCIRPKVHVLFHPT